jgi:hypothetical protein
MVDPASRLRANFPHFTLIDAVGNNCFGGVLARLELRPFRFVWGVGFFFPNFYVLVAWNRLLALQLLVGRADLDKLRLGGDLGLYVSQLRAIAFRVGALCGIWANSKSFLLAPGRRADRVGQQATQRTASTGMSGRIRSHLRSCYKHGFELRRRHDAGVDNLLPRRVECLHL